MGCCGRALISNGLLDEARITCRNTADELTACVDASAAVAIVGCEPSCISAITDDWLDLNMRIDDEVLLRLAERSMLIEDFIEARWDEHPAKPALNRSGEGEPLLVHGHCHQKSLWGVQRTASLLRRAHDGEVRVLDSGCCGMAGAFGFAREHYDLSLRIAEQSLLSEVRASPVGTVVAPGTSCRHQVRDSAGREAVHPIELIAEALGGRP
jgi:Fe-S oxidoreductase